MKVVLHNCFKTIINLENLLEAWKEFVKGKKSKPDVQRFSLNLMDNILSLHFDLLQNEYQHGPYKSFWIFDPKPRKIHKAAVRDRLLHHAIYRVLYPFFDKKFASDSFSCRNEKGTHKAINRFRNFAFKVTKNNTKTCWVLQCDIKKFFPSVDHRILIRVLQKHIDDHKTILLLKEIIESYSLKNGNIGLPLGNLTSQLFVNIFMNELDQYIKHKLKGRYYIRYTDDFVVLSVSKKWLGKIMPKIKLFLERKLRLSLHPNKMHIKTLASGVDFLGWVHFADHRVMRTTTKKRMLKRLKSNQSKETIASYFGLLNHGNTNKLKKKIIRMIDKRKTSPKIFKSSEN